MIMKSDMAISLAGIAFTDELHTNLGSAAISLRDTEEDSGHDFFRSLTINTAAGGGGTALVESVDFTISEESITETTATGEKLGLSDRVSEYLGSTVHVYHKVQIINAIYQTGDLYLSGYYHGDLPSVFRLNKEKNRHYEIDSDDIIDSTFGCGKILCNAGASGIKLTLDFEKGQCIRFIKTDAYGTNKSAVTLVSDVAIDGFTAINGNYYLFLFQQHQNIEIYFDGTQYRIVGGWLDFSPKGNTSDWTNRHLGDLVIAYDTQTVAFSIGEKITLASGVTGIIVWLNATTMIVKHATGTGIGIDNETITGSWGGAALVNGNTKNNDSYIYHGTGLDQNNFSVELYIHTNTVFAMATAARNGRNSYVGTASTSRQWEQIGVDANNFKVQTGVSIVDLLKDDGTIETLDTEDYSYFISVKVYF